MVESAILVQSYSFTAPITRNESHEDNTLQAFSQSISFGKFMKENLEWGKWSSFTHNKYVEEAERYTRPGSVAQKRAFFEAHYNRISEAKKAATQKQPTITPAQVLLHTLETQPLPPPPPPLVIEQHQDVKDEEEGERNSLRIDNHVVSENKLVAMNGLKDELVEKVKENKKLLIGDGDDNEEKKQDKELLKEDWFDGDDKEEKKQGEELLKEDWFNGDEKEEEKKQGGELLKEDWFNGDEKEEKKLGEELLKEDWYDGDDKEEKKQCGELLKEDWFVDEEKKQKKQVMKNRPVFRLSLEEIIPQKSIDEITLTEKRSKRPITPILEKNEEKPVQRQRFSFLNCFMGNVETQEQNQSRQKRKTEKKKQKMFLCFCLKPKTERE